MATSRPTKRAVAAQKRKQRRRKQTVDMDRVVARQDHEPGYVPPSKIGRWKVYTFDDGTKYSVPLELDAAMVAEQDRALRAIRNGAKAKDRGRPTKRPADLLAQFRQHRKDSGIKDYEVARRRFANHLRSKGVKPKTAARWMKAADITKKKGQKPK